MKFSSHSRFFFFLSEMGYVYGRKNNVHHIYCAWVLGGRTSQVDSCCLCPPLPPPGLALVQLEPTVTPIFSLELMKEGRFLRPRISPHLMPLISVPIVVWARKRSISPPFGGSTVSLFLSPVIIRGWNPRRSYTSPLGWVTSGPGFSLSGSQEPGRLHSVNTVIQGQLVRIRGGTECVFQTLRPKQTFPKPSWRAGFNECLTLDVSRQGKALLIYILESSHL